MLTLEKLSALLAQNGGAASTSVKEFSLAAEHFAFNSEPAIMGVINLSPDSWYRESVCLTVDRAIARAHILRAQGARIIDVGAESTLANAVRVEASAQESKLLPLVRALAGAKMIVSVETYYASVAKSCLEAGAQIINLTGDREAETVFKLAAEHQAAVILCHVQGATVREVGEFNLTGDVIETMRANFGRLIDTASRCGAEKLLIDPGLGFYYRNLTDSAVRVRHQMHTFLNTFRLRTLGVPVCHALPHAFEYFGEEVRCAEPFFAVLAALGKTDLFRTHEVTRVRAVLETLKVF